MSKYEHSNFPTRWSLYLITTAFQTNPAAQANPNWVMATITNNNNNINNINDNNK